MYLEWSEYFGKIAVKDYELISTSIEALQRVEVEKVVVPKKGTDHTILGDEGEEYVFTLEKIRVTATHPRLTNKVLLLGNQRGLGYDISSVEANENIEEPEFARFIEVKSTKRITEPDLQDTTWIDTINLTRKEWIAAKQYRTAYNIYRVYFTPNSTIVRKINDPFDKNENGIISVLPTLYRMDFGSQSIDKQYQYERENKSCIVFCGCGGSDLGIIGNFNFLNQNYLALPFDINYALDFDKYAVETYNANFKHPAICDDIKNVNINQLENFDLLVGGFPCQSFSTVNPNKDTNDDRANLYKELVKILKTKQPKYFIAENVKGLMTLQKGEILKKVVDEFKAVGYEVKYKLLLASNFGIPQRRERLFIVGVRNDIKLNYQFPEDTHSDNSLFNKKNGFL